MPVAFEIGPWWAFVVRGILAIAFGVLTFLFPGMALFTLIMLFAAYAVIEGAFNVAAAFQKAPRPVRPWWQLLLAGAVSILAGALAFWMPGLTALTLLYVIGALVIVRGALEIGAAVRLRKVIEGEWLLVLGGALSVAFGLLLMLFPGAGALAVVLWIGAYAVVFGALLVGVGLKVRRLARTGRPGPELRERELAHGVSH